MASGLKVLITTFTVNSSDGISLAARYRYAMTLMPTILFHCLMTLAIAFAYRIRLILFSPYEENITTPQLVSPFLLYFRV